MQVQLGNADPKDLAGRRITSVSIPDEYTLLEAAATVVAADGVWANHAASSDCTPDWVESDNDTLAALLSEHFGCPTKRPKSWKETFEDPANVPAETDGEDDK